MSRGFLPSYTYSAHLINHPEFRGAIGQFLQQERLAIEKYKQTLDDNSPFKANI